MFFLFDSFVLGDSLKIGLVILDFFFVFVDFFLQILISGFPFLFLTLKVKIHSLSIKGIIYGKFYFLIENNKLNDFTAERIVLIHLSHLYLFFIAYFLLTHVAFYLHFQLAYDLLLQYQLCCIYLLALLLLLLYAQGKILHVLCQFFNLLQDAAIELFDEKLLMLIVAEGLIGIDGDGIKQFGNIMGSFLIEGPKGYILTQQILRNFGQFAQLALKVLLLIFKKLVLFDNGFDQIKPQITVDM